MQVKLVALGASCSLHYCIVSKQWETGAVYSTRSTNNFGYHLTLSVPSGGLWLAARLSVDCLMRHSCTATEAALQLELQLQYTVFCTVHMPDQSNHVLAG